MRRFLIFSVSFFFVLAMCAQNKIGQWTIVPTAGFNVANVTDLSGSTWRVGLAAGTNFEYGMMRNFDVSIGCMYSMQGCKDKTDGVKNTWKIDYINMPILGHYYVLKGLDVKTGIQFGFRCNAKCQGESFAKECNNFEVGIPVGLSYEYQNVVLDARYNIGLTKIFKKRYSDLKCNNCVFQFTLGYKIGI